MSALEVFDGPLNGLPGSETRLSTRPICRSPVSRPFSDWLTRVKSRAALNSERQAISMRSPLGVSRKPERPRWHRRKPSRVSSEAVGADGGLVHQQRFLRGADAPGFCHRDEHPQQFQIDIA